MSEARRTVGIVAEGPTDHTILVAAAERVLGSPIVPLFIQPDASDALGGFGDLGGGWKGVRGWCRRIAEEPAGLRGFMSSSYGPVLDVLVIHVDADIAGDGEVNCAKPCPPARDTVLALCQEIRGWLRAERLPAGVVLAIPSKSIESWILVALGANPDECDDDPAGRLTRAPYKRLRTKAGKPKKERGVYEELATVVAQAWPDVRAGCWSAQRFSLDLESASSGGAG
jgi:hypothetical protein